jgi:hypothetical protein
VDILRFSDRRADFRAPSRRWNPAWHGFQSDATMAAHIGWCPAAVRGGVNPKSVTTLGHRGDQTITSLVPIANTADFDRRDAMNHRIGLCD